MRVYDQLYIDGQWVAPSGAGALEVVDSATEEVIATVPDGDATDVDRAVVAARRAFEAWSAVPGEERAKFLSRIKDGLEARRDELAGITAREVGMTLPKSYHVQLGATIRR